MAKGVKVKICGLRKPIEAEVAVEAGADLLGVILCEARRRVSLEQAAEIFAVAPVGVAKVGIFVDPTLDEVRAAVEAAGLDMVQLCGSESADFCRSLPVPSLKSFRATAAGVQPDPAGYPGPIHHVDAPGVPGGAGIEWDWSLAAELASRYSLLLAGGLTAENVSDAIRAVRPWGVDVSSGVEEAGVKNLDMIREFVAMAKA